MIYLSQYIKKDEFARVGSNIPKIMRMRIDKGYFLEVYYHDISNVADYCYLFVDKEVTLGNIIEIFAKEWRIDPTRVRVDIQTISNIKRKIETKNENSSIEISIEEAIIPVSDIYPANAGTNRRAKELYHRLEFQVYEPTTLPDEYFDNLIKLIENYRKFEKYLEEREQHQGTE